MHIPFDSYSNEPFFMHSTFGFLPGFGGVTTFIVLLTIALFLCWTLIWKGLALWVAARNGEKWWFVLFLLVNLLGIPEILYLVFFRSDKKPETASLFSAQNAVPAAESGSSEK